MGMISTVTQIRRAYSADYSKRKLVFLADATLSVGQLADILPAIVPNYNDFSARRVCKWLAANAPDARVWVGREYSPVLYIQGSPDTLARIQRAAKRALRADECHLTKADDSAPWSTGSGSESLSGHKFAGDVLRLWFD